MKAYILLLSCGASRAVDKELAPNLTNSGFIRCLKRLIARRGRPKIISSDNAKNIQSRGIQLTILTLNRMIPGRDLRTTISTADEDSDAWTRRQRCVQ